MSKSRSADRDVVSTAASAIELAAKDQGTRWQPEKSALAEPLEKTLGSFALQQLDSAGLLEIAEAVCRAAALDKSSAKKLLRASFPCLAKLVELSPKKFSAPAERSTLPVHPVLYFPLAKQLSQSNPSQTAGKMCELLSGVLEQHRGILRGANETLHISIDQWVCGGEWRTILDTLSEFRRDFQEPLRIVGPSTGEIKTMLNISASEELESRLDASFFGALRFAGIQSIDGGSDLRIHTRAAVHGFDIVYAHNLTRSRLSGIAPGGAEQAAGFGREFLEEIFELRKAIIKTGKLAAWFPWSTVVLDSGISKSDAPLGLEMLLSMMYARLLLPEVPLIRAPISLLGAKLTQTALFLGANDLGYVAVDRISADQLGLPRMDTVLEQFCGDAAQFLDESAAGNPE